MSTFSLVTYINNILQTCIDMVAMEVGTKAGPDVEGEDGRERGLLDFNVTSDGAHQLIWTGQLHDDVLEDKQSAKVSRDMLSSSPAPISTAAASTLTRKVIELELLAVRGTALHRQSVYALSCTANIGIERSLTTVTQVTLDFCCEFSTLTLP